MTNYSWIQPGVKAVIIKASPKHKQLIGKVVTIKGYSTDFMFPPFKDANAGVVEFHEIYELCPPSCIKPYDEPSEYSFNQIMESLNGKVSV